MTATSYGENESFLNATCLLWKAVSSLIATVQWLLWSILSFPRIWIAARKFPAPGKCVPVLGHLYMAHQLDTPGLVKYAIKEAQGHPVGVVWFGPYPFFYVCDPRDIERIVNNPKCSEKPWMYNIAACGMSPGLVTLSGETWERHHRIIAPTFHKQVLDSFLPVYNNLTDFFIKGIKKDMKQTSFDASPLIKRLFLALIFESAMGASINSLEDPVLDVVDDIIEIEECILDRILRPWLYPDWTFWRSSVGRRLQKARAVTDGIRAELVKNRVLELEKLEKEGSGVVTAEQWGKKRRLAFLDHVLLAAKTGEPISMEEIKHEMDNINGAAFDTVSVAFSYTLYELARHPEVQDKVLEELKSIFDPSQEKIDITPAVVSRLVYLEMALKETLRIHPPSPLILRVVREDVPLASCNLKIPAGAHVAISNILAHMDPENYPEPEKFNPDHFLPDNVKKRHQHAFFPFSAGIRGCVGKRLAIMELKAVLAKVLWEIEFMEEPSYTPIDSWAISMKPINGLVIRARERKR